MDILKRFIKWDEMNKKDKEDWTILIDSILTGVCVGIASTPLWGVAAFFALGAIDRIIATRTK